MAVLLLETTDQRYPATGNHYEKINAGLTLTNLNETLLIDAKGSQPTIDLRFTNIETNISENLVTDDAMKAYVNSQIISGGIDYSEIGDSLDLVRINAANDALEGVDPSNYQTDYTVVGDPDDVVTIDGAGTDITGITKVSLVQSVILNTTTANQIVTSDATNENIIGKTFPNDFLFDNSNTTYSNLGTAGQILTVNGTADGITAVDNVTATGYSFLTDPELLVPSQYTYVEDAIAYLAGKSWPNHVTVTIRLADGEYTPSTTETTNGYILLEATGGKIQLEGTNRTETTFTSQTVSIVHNATYDDDMTITVADASNFSVTDIVNIYGFSGGSSPSQTNKHLASAPIISKSTNDIEVNVVTNINGVSQGTTGNGKCIKYYSIIKNIAIKSNSKIVSLYNFQMFNDTTKNAAITGSFGMVDYIGISGGYNASYGVVVTLKDDDVTIGNDICIINALASSKVISCFDGKIYVNAGASWYSKGSGTYNRYGTIIIKGVLNDFYRKHSASTNYYVLHTGKTLFDESTGSITMTPAYGAINAYSGTNTLNPIPY